jgi:hypothetical protein
MNFVCAYFGWLCVFVFYVSSLWEDNGFSLVVVKSSVSVVHWLKKVVIWKGVIMGNECMCGSSCLFDGSKMYVSESLTFVKGWRKNFNDAELFRYLR